MAEVGELDLTENAVSRVLGLSPATLRCTEEGIEKVDVAGAPQPEYRWHERD